MDKLPSLINADRLAMMYILAESSPPGDFIEVGVFQGGSAEVLYDVASLQKRKLSTM